MAAPENIRNSDQDNATNIVHSLVEVAAVNSKKSPVFPTAENIQRSRIQQLLAETAFAKNDAEKSLPDDPELLRDDLLKSLRADVEGLEVLVLHARKKRSALRIELKEQTRMKTEQLAIEDRLKRELNESRNNTSSSSSQAERAEDELRKKLATTEKLLRKRMVQMSDFLKEHYPKPTAEEIRLNKNLRRKNERSTGNRTDAGTVKTLQLMLEILMNKCIDSPEDAYIEIDASYWPPYVEMLLRYGIIQRHPNLLSRIRLIPYHL